MQTKLFFNKIIDNKIKYYTFILANDFILYENRYRNCKRKWNFANKAGC